MSEIRLVKVPSRNVLSSNDRYYVVHLSDANAIFNGSRDISREDCEVLSDTYALCRLADDRLYILASKAGMIGSLKLRTMSYQNASSVPFSSIKEMFCTVCGSFLDKGQRHVCNAPRCSECGEFLSPVDVKNGRTMCKKCRAEYIAQIRCYHGWHAQPLFQKPEKRSDVLHMGTEIETIYHDDLEESIEGISAIANPDPWKHNLRFERDCTVTVEMITEPKTLRGYHDCKELRAAMERAEEDGHFCDERTGGHIHLDRKFFGKRHETCSAMLCYLVAVFWDDFFYPISRREDDEWCRKPNAEKEDTILDVYKKNSHLGYSDHHTAVNCGNNGTIELRFWAGTIDYDQKLADLDISRAMAIWAKKTSCENLMNSKVSDIFRYIEYPETFEYIRSRVTNSEILSAIPD